MGGRVVSPECQSCGAYVTKFDPSRAAEPHKETCPWGDPDFVATVLEHYAGLLKAGVFA